MNSFRQVIRSTVRVNQRCQPSRYATKNSRIVIQGATKKSFRRGAFPMNHRRRWLGTVSSKDKEEEKTNAHSKSATSSESSSPATVENPKPSVLPGITLSAAVAGAGFAAASGITDATGIPLSGIPLAILTGATVRNTLGYSSSFKPGIVFATKTILQGGIVCVAAKLSFVELLSTGRAGLPVVLSAVGAGLWFIPRAGQKAGLTHELSLLLTAGTSICGVTAITALAPAIGATHRDTAVAVANTVAFGTLGMLLYPYVFHGLCSGSEQVGVCLGVAIHDTSQVLGAALSYKETFGDEVAFKVAAVTKLMRNLGLAVAIPMLTYQHATAVAALASSKDTADASASPSSSSNASSSSDGTMSGLQSFTKYVPPFLVAFIGMTAARTGGDIFLADWTEYTQAMNFLGSDVSKYTLGTAMAGVGLSTDKSSLQGVGWKPFAVGLSGALVVGGTGFTVAMLTV